MATGGNIGNGSKLGYSLTSPTSYVRVGQIMDTPKWITLVRNLVDTTVHSTSFVMTSIPGMAPTPEVQIKLLADFDTVTSPTHETLRGFQTNGTSVWWRLEVPVQPAQTTFRAWEFLGTVREYTPTIQIAAVQTIMVTITFGGSLSVYNAAASILG